MNNIPDKKFKISNTEMNNIRGGFASQEAHKRMGEKMKELGDF